MKTNFILIIFTIIEIILSVKIKLIPEEINYPVFIEPSVIKSRYIINKNLYKENLEKQRVTLYQESMSNNGRLYYKQPQSYYGPEKTYYNIPKVKDIQFETPVIIEKLEIFDDEETIREELLETEKELTNLLLFTQEPKYYSNYTVKDNSALPYYDSTYESKILRIRALKNRILEIRKQLNISNEEVSFYVEVKNKTFPKKADDIVRHYNESYFKVNQFDQFNNGDIREIDDMYNLRDVHLRGNFRKNKTEVLNNIRQIFNKSDRSYNNKNIPEVDLTLQKWKQIRRADDNKKENINQPEIKKSEPITINNNNDSTPIQTIVNPPLIPQPIKISHQINIQNLKSSPQTPISINKNNEESDEEDINNLL